MVPQTPSLGGLCPPPLPIYSALADIVVTVSVRLCVCLSVGEHISRTTGPIFIKILVAQSSSDGAVVRYVLPVVWMTSCL